MRIGLDLGGTKIEAIALDDSGNILLRRRMPTPTGDYAGTIAAIVYLVRKAQNEVGKATVGIATPGAISVRTGLLKNSNSTALNGKPIERDLRAALDQPIKIENDANCLAISETVDGAGANARIVFGVILGTGVGGGLVIDRQIWAGLNRIAGSGAIILCLGQARRSTSAPMLVIAASGAASRRGCRVLGWHENSSLGAVQKSPPEILPTLQRAVMSGRINR